MTVVGDVPLELQKEARRSGRVSRLRLRVFWVLHEFESTRAELHGDYRGVAAVAAACG